MRPRVERCGWPKTLTFTVRRTKLAPGEVPTLFTLNGYKYSCVITSKTTLSVQRRDARHRVHARVEDRVRTTKDAGLDHLPSKSWAVNLGWCHAVAIASDPIAWFKLIGCTGELAKAEPQTCATESSPLRPGSPEASACAGYAYPRPGPGPRPS